MPKPSEVAEIVAGGQRYGSWQEVEVFRDYREVVSEIRLTVAEIGDLKHGWKSVRLKPGDPCEAYLAGRLVATGRVAVRQVAYDANTHAVRFIVQSKVADLVNGTVEAKPGQFKKYTLQQIASAVLGKYGVAFKFVGGMPSGAEKVFERVSMHVGESPFELVERLGRMRNVHLVDDAQGNLTARRGAGPVVADLQEDGNIFSAQLVWREDQAISEISATGAIHGNDHRWGDDARANAAKATNPLFGRYRPLVLVAEQPGDQRDMQMRADHEVGINVGAMVTCNVTVQGWLRGSRLWIEDIGNSVSVYSPMLFPQDSVTMAIQAVAHAQGSRGTTTTLTLVMPWALGTPNAIQANGGPTSASPAIPYAPDDV